MRKIVISTLMLIIILPAMAQNRWSFIPQVGLQISNVKNNVDFSTKPILGYRIGAIEEYQFSQGILGDVALQVGAFVSLKGVEKNPYCEVKYHYVEVPLLLKMGLHLTKEVDVHLKAGPYFGYSFAGHSEVYPPVGSPSSVTPMICAYDYGVEVGLGAKYRRMVFNLGTNIGLYDFYIDRKLDNRVTLMNRSLHFTVGYEF